MEAAWGPVGAQLGLLGLDGLYGPFPDRRDPFSLTAPLSIAGW